MKKEDRLILWLVLATIVLIAVGKIIYAVNVYGDWTCAIAKCIKVKP